MRKMIARPRNVKYRRQIFAVRRRGNNGSKLSAKLSAR